MNISALEYANSTFSMNGPGSLSFEHLSQPTVQLMQSFPLDEGVTAREPAPDQPRRGRHRSCQPELQPQRPGPVTEVGQLRPRPHIRQSQAAQPTQSPPTPAQQETPTEPRRGQQGESLATVLYFTVSNRHTTDIHVGHSVLKPYLYMSICS